MHSMYVFFENADHIKQSNTKMIEDMKHKSPEMNAFSRSWVFMFTLLLTRGKEREAAPAFVVPKYS